MVNTKMIAIVDDDAACSHALQFLLDVVGYGAQTFVSAAAFLAAGPENYACLILDQHMPVMTGLELAQRLRAAHIAIPIMLISGNLTSAITTKARALGIDETLEKPPNNDEVVAFVDGALGEQGA